MGMTLTLFNPHWVTVKGLGELWAWTLCLHVSM